MIARMLCGILVHAMIVLYVRRDTVQYVNVPVLLDKNIFS